MAAISPAVSVAADGEACSPATCGKLWVTLVFAYADFSRASAMSADANAVLGGADALVLVVVLLSVSGLSDMLLCLSCCACILCIPAGV